MAARGITFAGSLNFVFHRLLRLIGWGDRNNQREGGRRGGRR
jgi:hypothetical protein